MFAAKNQWSNPDYDATNGSLPLSDAESLQFLESENSTQDFSRSLDDMDGSIQNPRRTPSPGVSSSILAPEHSVVQSPPADAGCIRPKCTSSPAPSDETEVAGSTSAAAAGEDTESDQSENDSQSKPPYSYIALISMAILGSPDRKLLLGDIYQWIMDKYPYYRNTDDRAWRNSVRHNLSLNECFIKKGRADNGKGNYWAIHEACEEDFSKGDYRRRQARRRARRSTQLGMVSQLPPQCRYNLGYVPMTKTTTNFGLSYNPYAHPRALQFQYANPMATAYPGYPEMSAFGSPNVTITTPGSGYIHQQHMSLTASPMSTSGNSLNDSGNVGTSLAASPQSLYTGLSRSPPSGSGHLNTSGSSLNSSGIGSLGSSPTSRYNGLASGLSLSPPSGYLGTDYSSVMAGSYPSTPQSTSSTCAYTSGYTTNTGLQNNLAVAGKYTLGGQYTGYTGQSAVAMSLYNSKHLADSLKDAVAGLSSLTN